MLRNLILFLFLIISLSAVKAQDNHFSQFYSSPLTLNPALTGAFNAKYRIGLINRDQWRSVADNPYRTFSVSLEVKFGLDYFLRFAKRDKIAVGLVFYNDQVEGVDFRELRMALSLAYHKSLDKKSRNILTLGFQGGISQRNLNFTGLIFDDQFNELDAFNLPTLEGIPVNNFTYGDYAVGLNYSLVANRDVSFFAGAALNHIFEPNISFFEDNFDQQLDATLPRTIVTHAGAVVKLTNSLQLSPRFLALFQEAHFQATGGANLRIKLDQFNTTALYVGLWTRVANDALNSIINDSVIASVGFELDGFLLSLSYDLNTTAITNLSTRQGSFEISLAYLGEYDNETILCPKF